ncbi:hypothetical protein RU308_004612 [Salmonella enterica]|nr:hypothetical protein [Salmonella enterica]
MKMLIRDSGERAARHQEKIETVLQYLGREKWSDFATLNRLFGFKNHRVMYDLLNKITSAGALTKHRAGKTSLWSITTEDLSQLSERTIRSGIARQNARISFEEMGATEWKPGREITVPSPMTHKPTALVRMNDRRIAVEVHAAMRTQLRYRQLVTQHLFARGLEQWDRAVFVCANEHLRNAIQMTVNNLEYVTENGIRRALEPRHYDFFRFVTLDGLKASDRC